MMQPSDIGARRFAHQAMNTEFEIFCGHGDADYAQQAAWAAFDLLDRMERELSRFVPNSDISRINHAGAGGERAGEPVDDGMSRAGARGAFRETGGAFDISLRQRVSMRLRAFAEPCETSTVTQ